MTEERGRRRFLGTLGLVAAGGIGGLAGCTGRTDTGGDGGSTPTAEPSATPEPTATPAETEAGTATADPTSTTRTVTDMAGRTVEVPGTVERVVGLGTGALRLVTYLGGTDRVVGVESFETTNEDRPFRPYVVANPTLADRPAIGSRKSPAPERILQREPDVVFWGYASEGSADDLQSKLGVPVVVLRQGDLTPELRPTFYEALGLVGEVLGAADRAEELVGYTKETIADMNARASSDPPTAYVGYMGRGKHGFTRSQPAYAPFSIVGADNVVDGIADDRLKGKKGAPEVNVDPEQLIEWDPEYVFVDLGTESYDALGNEEYRSMRAIESGNVHALFPNRDYAANFGTVLANAYYVGSVLFPGAYDDVDPTAKADEVYETFIGTPIYDDLVEAYGRGIGPMEVP